MQQLLYIIEHYLRQLKNEHDKQRCQELEMTIKSLTLILIQWDQR
jgi:hypothetical protein